MPTRTEKSRFEKTENIELKKPLKPFSTRRSGLAPNRNPAATAVASPSDAHPWTTPNGARVTATTTMPESTMSVIEIPGTSAILSHASSSSNHRAAIAPGTTSSNASANTTHNVCPGFPKIPG